MFPTTRRSVIVALASDDEEQRRRAFDTFVAIYWKPLYKYLRVARTRDGAERRQQPRSDQTGSLHVSFGRTAVEKLAAE